MVEGLSGLRKQELAPLKERADQLRHPWLAPKERKDALLSLRHHRCITGSPFDRLQDNESVGPFAASNYDLTRTCLYLLLAVLGCSR